MGNTDSMLREHGMDLNELQEQTQFTEMEIRRLAKRFQKLDTDKSGTLSIEEVMQLPELKQNPLVARVFSTFDADGGGDVDFQEFISALSIFTAKSEKERKLKFAFYIYDMDRDGFISNGELYHVLKMMVGNNLKEGQLQQIVDKTIMYADKDGDGKLSYEEFSELVSSSDFHEKMNVQI
eukprot:Clim_evm18s119 gene=Clim_evmTU18s119